jgi:hypothetical protein
MNKPGFKISLSSDIFESFDHKLQNPANTLPKMPRTKRRQKEEHFLYLGTIL